MNHLRAKTLNRAVAHNSLYNVSIRAHAACKLSPSTSTTPGARRLKSDHAATSRAATTKSKISPKKDGKHADVTTHPGSSDLEQRNFPADSQGNDTSNDKPLPYENAPSVWKESSFLTPYMRKSPALYKSVKFLYDGLGLYAKQGDSIRNGKKTYMSCCERDLIEEAWIYDTCKVPRTFHSWFQITNMHVWLLTIRFRALPTPHGRYTLQALVDFFFEDIENRLRALLGPRISERTITGYMREYKELWNGSQIALDIGLVGGDWELAGAVWRNLFDARGWDLGGTVGEDGLPGTVADPVSDVVSLTGNGGPRSVDASDKNLAANPIHVYTLVAYLRRELKRLEAVPDENIIQHGDVGSWGKMTGGDMIQTGPISEAELERWKKVTDGIGNYR